MKYYLSSYKIGNKPEQLKKMIPKGKKMGFVPNALDYAKDKERMNESNLRNIKELRDLGIKIEVLDLKEYFGKSEKLKRKIASLGGIWVRGGNTFVLRQAMKLSGLDNILKNMKRKNFLYSGYSAGGCVLSPNLESTKIVDDPKENPYLQKEIVWDGLGLIDYVLIPHYKSEHPESKDVDKEVAHCKKKNIPFRTLRDGEVIIIE